MLYQTCMHMQKGIVKAVEKNKYFPSPVKHGKLQLLVLRSVLATKATSNVTNSFYV